MEQKRHTDADCWVTPTGAHHLLVEMDFEDEAAGSNLELPAHQRLTNLSKATVRGVSPKLPDPVAEKWLPDGIGSFGKRVMVPKEAPNFWDEPVYEACGLTAPQDNNAYGELGFVSIARIIAYLEESEHLPFTPVGSIVFFEHDYKEGKGRFVGVESGDIYEQGEDTDEIVTPEDSEAAKNTLGTVLGTGDKAELLSAGDRIIAPRFADSIPYEGTTYAYVTDETEIRGKIENPDADIELEKAQQGE